MREKGIVVTVAGLYENVIRIQPPFMITKDQLDNIIEALDQSIREVEKESH
jgi:4-aminobutyrate aminotransferase-like enzyme